MQYTWYHQEGVLPALGPFPACPVGSYGTLPKSKSYLEEVFYLISRD